MWKVFVEKYLPSILKMGSLSHTPVTRHAACQIIIAATNFATGKKCLSENLMTPYLELCQDTDMVIRSTTLKNVQKLIKVLDAPTVEEQIYPEVLHIRFKY